MFKILKRLFCKHEWEIQYSFDADGGTMVTYRCHKCGKQNIELVFK